MNQPLKRLSPQKGGNPILIRNGKSVLKLPQKTAAPLNKTPNSAATRILPLDTASDETAFYPSPATAPAQSRVPIPAAVNDSDETAFYPSPAAAPAQSRVPAPVAANDSDETAFYPSPAAAPALPRVPAPVAVNDSDETAFYPSPAAAPALPRVPAPVAVNDSDETMLAAPVNTTDAERKPKQVFGTTTLMHARAVKQSAAAAKVPENTTVVGRGDAGSQEALPLPQGTKIGPNKKYTITDCLGVGGFGVSYSIVDNNGIDLVLKESYPAKLMFRDPKTGDLTIRAGQEGNMLIAENAFKEECRILNQAQHANIVRITEQFSEHNTLYYVMTKVPGCSLKKLRERYVEEKKNFTEKEITEILRQMLKALRCLHRQAKVLHRDIKPDNILADKDSYILIDFGIACHIEDLPHESIKGSRGFAAPEQLPSQEQLATMTPEDRQRWVSKLGPYSDIYALGASIYFLMTGKKFTPDEKHLKEVRSIPGYSTPLLLSLQHALNPDFTKRTQSADEWEHELEEEQRQATEKAEKLRQDKEKRDSFIKDIETRVRHNHEIDGDRLFKLETIMGSDPHCNFLYGCILLSRNLDAAKALEVAKNAAKSGNKEARQLLGNCILVQAYEKKKLTLSILLEARKAFVNAADRHRTRLCDNSIIEICLYRALAILLGFVSAHNFYLMFVTEDRDQNLATLRQKQKQILILQLAFTILTAGVGSVLVWVMAIIESFTITKRFKPQTDISLFNEQ